ncbi:hypothetical protein LguiB_000958 [Lonicera macranthoides]
MGKNSIVQKQVILYHQRSYGSTLRYKSVQRLKPVGKHSLIGGSGEIRDFQAILRKLDELNYGHDSYCSGYNYIWTGLKDCPCDGVKLQEWTITWQLDLEITLPAHFCAKNGMRENLSFEDGVKLLEKCMLVLLYRDRSAVNKLQNPIQWVLRDRIMVYNQFACPDPTGV